MRVPRTVFRERGGELEPESERAAMSLAVSTVVEDAVGSYLDRRRKWFKIGVGIATVGVGFSFMVVLLMALLGVGIGVILLVNLPIVLVSVGVGGVAYWYVVRQTPDVEIERVEKGYWPTYLIPDSDGTVVYDATGRVGQSEFTLEKLHDAGRIQEARGVLSEIGELPALMPRGESVEASVLSTIQDAHHVLESAEQQTVRAPLVTRGDPVVGTIGRLRAHASAEPVAVGPREWAVGDATEDIAAMFDLQQLAREESEGVDLESVSETGIDVVDRISATQDSAVGILSEHLERAGDVFALSTYNFYCPTCKFDDISSRLTASNPDDAADVQWVCETCESEFGQELVIPKHAIRDDLVDDIWHQLWVEKDDQRREVYENIEDQHHELREREFEQAREEIRTVTDRIRDLQARLRDFKTEARAGEGKVDEIGDLMVEYDRLNASKKDEFVREVSQTYQRINDQVDQNVEEMQAVRNERIEAAQADAREKAKALREEQRHEEWERFMLGQQLQDERTQQLLASDDRGHQLMANGIRDILEEQESLHKDEILLETEGELSRFDVVNEARWLKGNVMGRSTAGGE